MKNYLKPSFLTLIEIIFNLNQKIFNYYIGGGEARETRGVQGSPKQTGYGKRKERTNIIIYIIKK
jgi:hypothetical protein